MNPRGRKSRRTVPRWYMLYGLCIVLLGIAIPHGWQRWQYYQTHESTDDAYVVSDIVPLSLQRLRGYSVLGSSLIQMPRMLIMFVATPIAGRLYNDVDGRLLIGAGVAMMMLGYFDLAHLTPEVGPAKLLPGFLRTGAGMSCMFGTMSAVVMRTVPQPMLTAASGLHTLFHRHSAPNRSWFATRHSDGQCAQKARRHGQSSRNHDGLQRCLLDDGDGLRRGTTVSDNAGRTPIPLRAHSCPTSALR